MSIEALTSAEISLPARPDAGLVRSRIAILAKHVDLVGLTDNHAGQPRMSPLAAVALAREQGVATVVHVSCRDRNRLALRSQVVGAAALGCDGVLCLYGDPVPDVPRVRDYTTTRLLAEAKSWVEPYELPRRAYSRIASGGGIDMAIETAIALAELPQVDALHVMAWGSEDAAGKVAAAFRAARGAPVERSAAGTG